MAKIYVASSWRNQYYPDVVKKLREYGHEVYDFRNPPHNHGAFLWKNIDPGLKAGPFPNIRMVWSILHQKDNSRPILMH